MGMVSHLSRLPRNKLRLLLLPRRCWVLLILGGCLPMAYYLLSTTTVISIPNRSLQDLTSRLVVPLASDKESSSLSLSETSAQQKPARLSPSEVAERFEQRLTHLHKACSQIHNMSVFHPYTKPARAVILNAHWPIMNVSLQYCPIQKISSTTWYRTINKARRYMKDLTVETPPEEAGEPIKFLFVREPYSRLLSGYVDKLLSPNTLFWKLTGHYVIPRFRPNASNFSIECGHNVTFLEYVQYVLSSQETLIHRNGHFLPTHDHCDVCNINYTYIGHLETIGEDMPYLLNVLQIPGNNEQDYDNHTIFDNAGWVLKAMRSKISKCMTMYEACLRLWKKWHIRGIISKTEPLPVSAEQAETISMEDFVALALQALARSTDKAAKRRQKTEALREAFTSLPLDVRQQVRDMLTLDFDLFGFDPSPESVFPQTPLEHDDGYRYFDLTKG